MALRHRCANSLRLPFRAIHLPLPRQEKPGWRWRARTLLLLLGARGAAWRSISAMKAGRCAFCWPRACRAAARRARPTGHIGGDLPDVLLCRRLADDSYLCCAPALSAASPAAAQTSSRARMALLPSVHTRARSCRAWRCAPSTAPTTVVLPRLPCVVARTPPPLALPASCSRLGLSWQHAAVSPSWALYRLVHAAHLPPGDGRRQQRAGRRRAPTAARRGWRHLLLLLRRRHGDDRYPPGRRQDQVLCRHRF